MDKALVLADRLKKLKDQVDSLATKQTEIQTIKGDQGPKGEQGDRGFDGAPGLDGRDGKDGKDGAEGKDGVSVVKAEIAFDGSLVLYLSNGDQIDCGEVTPEKSKEVFQTIKNSGGSSPINIFTSVLPGLVPASGGGTVNFLRADGTFAAPPTTAPAGSTTQIQFNNAGAFGASANLTYTSGTNTVSFGNITGSALGMTIQTRAPTSLETPGTLLLLGQNAIKANTDGGSVRLKGGAKTGSGQPGKAELESQDGKYVVRASNAGVDIFGEYSSSFSFTQGVFNAVGSQTAPLIDSPNVFVAGLNSTSTGNASFQFLTDSQVVFEFGEPIFGSQELAFFGVVPVTQPTTATAAATRVAVVGTVANIGDTYDGYTLAKVVKALRNLGILA